MRGCGAAIRAAGHGHVAIRSADRVRVRVKLDVLGKLEYPEHFVVKKITTGGTFLCDHRLLDLANAMVDQHIGLEETDDGVWSIFFAVFESLCSSQCLSSTSRSHPYTGASSGKGRRNLERIRERNQPICTPESGTSCVQFQIGDDRRRRWSQQTTACLHPQALAHPFQWSGSPYYSLLKRLSVRSFRAVFAARFPWERA